MKNVRTGLALLATVLLTCDALVRSVEERCDDNTRNVIGATVDIEQTLRQLHESDCRVRAKTLDNLRGTMLPSVIVEAVGDVLVQDNCSMVRLAALHLLAKEYSEKRLELVSQALEDSDPLVRANAAIVLGRWGHKAAPAIPMLLSALTDRRNEVSVDVHYVGDLVPVRYYIATAIGQVSRPGATEVISELVRAMRDPREDEGVSMVRVAAALAVIRIKNGDAQALEVLTDALDHRSEKVRWEAVSSIAAAGPKGSAALETLLKQLPKENSHYVRSAYMEAFGSLGVRERRIVHVLASALDEKGCVRDSAIRSLAKMGRSAQEALPRIEAILLSNPDPDDYCNRPQFAAVEAVVRIAEPEVAMCILRTKLTQVNEGVELARYIIPHLPTHGPEGEKNRKTLQWLLEECHQTEREISEVLNRLGRPPNTGANSDR